LGFASDTTAILFYELWEGVYRDNIPVSSSGKDYYGWELMLVDDVWWEEEIGWMCLMRDKCNLSLLSAGRDTVSSVDYAYGCEKFNGMFFYRHFIRAELDKSALYSGYPVLAETGESSSAMFQYDKNGKIMQEPSFWMYRGEDSRYLKFVDSLGNVARY
jgi:hypothetical protein